MDHDAQQLADRPNENLTQCKAHLVSHSLNNAKFPKSARLLSPKQFKFVFAKAQKFSNRHWTFIVRPNQQAAPRLGLAIAKKQLMKSVWRNRVKRLARETFRQHKQALSGYDIVVLGRRGMQEVDNETLCNSFEHLIRQLKKRGKKPVEDKK
ncbi:ribonuclease P protein component [Hydrogenovibrio sp. SC-1]|uniref:ribonuclease P protein component n=1 Tax=Hydrogenovibrio sp. SC-1 TaxID=2065820 RepID=UPI000C79BE33|nr:ribonuclease P protein component [Hydrogenovibrio sp. SC-1]PLA74645.1 ribonuclease P protein component [Hydrogenovibrio sp. SC-1]